MTCVCSSEACKVLGCQQQAEALRKYEAHQTTTGPISTPVVPTYLPARTLTEDDVRRIVREEIARSREGER